MIKTIIRSFNMDLVYTSNSLIYLLSKLPILKDLLKGDIYKNKVFKNIIKIIVLLITIIKSVFFKFLYMIILLYICYTYTKDSVGISFVHLFFVFTILGMFINNKLLTSKISTYLSVVVFNTDGEVYFKSNLLFTNIVNFILNFICLYVIGYFTNIDIITISLLCITCLFTRTIGEVWNLDFYYKNGYLWRSKTIRYFIVCLLFILIGILPYFNFYILKDFILLCDIFLFGIFILSILYMNNFKYYKTIYKSVNNKTISINEKDNSSYSRQAIVEVKNKDLEINKNKVNNKHGYDLFNTIFFERHKEILTRSLYRFCILISIIYIVVIILIFKGNINNNINNFLLTKLGWFVLIMYFVNRGSIITQAMFFNCDHAMLTYNFYRERDVILNNFKNRLIMVSKLNLMPALIIVIGNILLLYFSGGASVLTYFSISIFIICLSIFFSVHYLFLYYLFQPYNKDLQIKKFSYSFISIVTYLIAFYFTGFVYDSLLLSIFTFIFTIVYVFIALLLVYKYSPRTFKINK